MSLTVTMGLQEYPHLDAQAHESVWRVVHQEFGQSNPFVIHAISFPLVLGDEMRLTETRSSRRVSQSDRMSCNVRAGFRSRRMTSRDGSFDLGIDS